LQRIRELFRFFHLETSLTLFAAAAVQAITFILLGRGLGVENFSRLMVVLAITQLTIDLVSLGAGEALIRRVSRHHSQYPSALGHALVMTAATGPVVAAFVTLGAVFFDPVASPVPMIVFVFGELHGNRFSALAEHMFIGRSRIRPANGVRVATAFGRLLAVVLGMYAFNFRELSDWMLIQGVTTCGIGLLGLLFATAMLGAPKLALYRADISFGLLMTVNQAAASVQLNADRIILGLVAIPALVGVFSAANRAVQLALIPIMAILRNLFPSFFKVGEQGVGASLAFAVKNAPRVIAIGSFSGLMVALFANVVPVVLGPGYGDSGSILRWLSAVPLLRGIQFLFSDALTGADRQAWRTTLGVVGAFGYTAILAVLTPLRGIEGLIIGIYMHNFIMIMLLILVFRALARISHTTNCLGRTKFVLMVARRWPRGIVAPMALG